MTWKPWNKIHRVDELCINAEDEEPLSTNIFAYLPYDVLAVHLNPFLTWSDRVAFNQVVEPRERLFKRLSSTYVTRHYFRIMFMEHTMIMFRLNWWLQRNGREFTAIFHMHKLCDFLRHPMNRTLYQYDPRLKGVAISTLERLIDADFIAYRDVDLSPAMIKNLFTEIEKTLVYINKM